MLRLASGAAALTALAAIAFAPLAPAADAPAPVTLTENDATYTLSNGLVTAMVAKASGDLVSLKYNGLEMLASWLKEDGSPDLERDTPGANPRGLNSTTFTDHQYGFWSHDAMGPLNSEPKAVASVTIDPKANGGARAEVAIKGISGGRPMGTGPGSSMQGNFISDIEIRFAMDRGLAGVYTYCVFEHKPEYPASTITEARFCFKLADMFDWMLVDNTEHRNKLYPKESRENKYFYTTVQFDNRAFGWASTAKNVGCFLLNPSMEYMSGGPTKVEFLCHRDTNRIAAPTVLNYWRSSHYGGAGVSVAAGEQWNKVIGPFLIYCNSGATPEAMFANARAEQKKEEAKWPYAWVDGVPYPKKEQRGTVAGQLVLNDTFVPNAKMSRIRVGLTVPDRPPGPGTPRGQTWQTDAKNYQYWVYADDNGKFTIPNVRPGTYEFHALADGVLGEFKQADVTVAAGSTNELGKVDWQPLHYGNVVWEIGVPNRNPTEFFKGDDYFHNGMDVAYAEYFPENVRFVVGKSDPKKDWYYMHIPRASEAAVAARRGGAAPQGLLPGETRGSVAPEAMRGAGATPPAPDRGATSPTVERGAAGVAAAGGAPAVARGGAPRGGGGAGPGTATPWTIEFDLPKDGKGTAVLRIALARTATNNIAVGVNGEPTTVFTGLASDGSLGGTGVGIQGLWREYAVSLDASKLKQGTNTLTLTVPAGALTAGVCYDYVRLEMNENAPFPSPAP